jgi:hypothetical protein
MTMTPMSLLFFLSFFLWLLSACHVSYIVKTAVRLTFFSYFFFFFFFSSFYVSGPPLHSLPPRLIHIAGV